MATKTNIYLREKCDGGGENKYAHNHNIQTIPVNQHNYAVCEPDSWHRTLFQGFCALCFLESSRKCKPLKSTSPWSRWVVAMDDLSLHGYVDENAKVSSTTIRRSHEKLFDFLQTHHCPISEKSDWTIAWYFCTDFKCERLLQRQSRIQPVMNYLCNAITAPGWFIHLFHSLPSRHGHLPFNWQKIVKRL